MAGVELHAECQSLAVWARVGYHRMRGTCKRPRSCICDLFSACFRLLLDLMLCVEHTTHPVCLPNTVTTTKVEVRCRKLSAPAVVMQVRPIATHCQYAVAGLHRATSATVLKSIRPGMLGAGGRGRAFSILALPMHVILVIGPSRL